MHKCLDMRSMNILTNFLKSNSGAFTAIFAIMAPILIAGAGLAVDVGFWYSSKRDLQNAADAGAMGGGFELLRTKSQASASTEANNIATLNAGAGAQITTTFPANDLVRVVVQATAQTFFIGSFISNPPRIAAAATAQVTAGEINPPACLNLLDPMGEGLRINGNGRVVMGEGCGVQVNSSDERAVVVNGEGRLISDDVCVNGGVVTQSGSSISSVPKTGCPQITNPYEFLEEDIKALEPQCNSDPQVTIGGKVQASSGGGGKGKKDGGSVDPPAGNNNGPDVISEFSYDAEGISQSQITVQNGVTVTLNPGSSAGNIGGPILICHDLTVRSGGTLNVRGTLVFLNGARLNVQAGGNLNILQPEVETNVFRCLSIVASETNNATHDIRGGGQISISPGRGISVPGDVIDINGNSNLSSASVSITAKSLVVGGNTSIGLGEHPPTQPVPPRIGGDGSVILID
jgi:Flp pilus assembly protein TadG